jgi:predicted lysophospholipase L1 biosynthesis ABC-type transport system permease subunit
MDREDGEPVAIVSEMVANRMWPGENPIGKRVHFNLPDSIRWRTVVGVAEDAHLRTFRTASPLVYIPWRQLGWWQFNFAMRTRGEIMSLMPMLRRELAEVDPQLKLWYVHSTDELLSVPLTQPRMSAFLMSAFALAALTLAAMGLYVTMASLVRERTRELGIRMALGAAPEQLRRGVLTQALQIAGGGVVVGLATALATSKLLATILFEVSPADPVALAIACAILLVVILVAAYGPARRATKIDPASALRTE